MKRVPSTDGVELAVYDFGGDGPPLLLAHATGFCAHVWLPVVAHLADRFHCYAFDERGHGLTRTPGTETFDWHGFAEDTLAAIDGLGLVRPFAVGHSCGAAALLRAESFRPGTFRAIYGYEPVVIPADPPIGVTDDNPLAAGALRRRANFASRTDAYENFRSKPPFATIDADALAAFVEYGFEDLADGSVQLRCRPEDEAAVYAHGFAHDTFGRFALVTCPVVLACGEHTDAFGPDLISRQAMALPSVRTEVLAGLTHFGPLEDPAAFAARVVAAFGEG